MILKILLGLLLAVIFFYHFYRESKKIMPIFGPAFPISHTPRNFPCKQSLNMKRREITYETANRKAKEQANQNYETYSIENNLDPSEIYKFKCKNPKELTTDEYTSLQFFWENYLKNDSFFKEADMGLKDNCLVFLAYSPENRMVGQGNILVLDQHDLYGFFPKLGSLNLDFNSLILYNVCVDSNHRRLGIAKGLLTEIHTWAKNNGKKKIVLFVNKENQSALNLYQKLGYQIDNNYFPTSGGRSSDESSGEYLMQLLL